MAPTCTFKRATKSATRSGQDTKLLAMPCAKCGEGRDLAMITPCFHIYCKRCMLGLIMDSSPCATCRAVIFEFMNHPRTELINPDGTAKDARIDMALKLLRAGSDKKTATTADGTVADLRTKMKGVFQRLSGGQKQAASPTCYNELQSAEVQRPNIGQIASRLHDIDTLKGKAAEHDREGERVNKRLRMLEVSLAQQAANSDSYKHALFNKATSKNVRERFKDLTSLARGDNLKVLAVMQGGAVHPHVQAQIEYAEKLKALESRINDRMEDISKELVTMNAYIAELDAKECNFDPAEWDYDQQIGEVRNKLEELESDVSAATNACLKDIMGIAETGDKVAKKVDALTKNTAGLRKENEELKIALEKCQTEVNEHRALLKSVVEAMT